MGREPKDKPPPIFLDLSDMACLEDLQELVEDSFPGLYVKPRKLFAKLTQYLLFMANRYPEKRVLIVGTKEMKGTCYNLYCRFIDCFRQAQRSHRLNFAILK